MVLFFNFNSFFGNTGLSFDFLSSHTKPLKPETQLSSTNQRNSVAARLIWQRPWRIYTLHVVVGSDGVLWKLSLSPPTWQIAFLLLAHHDAAATASPRHSMPRPSNELRDPLLVQVMSDDHEVTWKGGSLHSAMPCDIGMRRNVHWKISWNIHWNSHLGRRYGWWLINIIKCMVIPQRRPSSSGKICT